MIAFVGEDFQVIWTDEALRLLFLLVRFMVPVSA